MSPSPRLRAMSPSPAGWAAAALLAGASALHAAEPLVLRAVAPKSAQSVHAVHESPALEGLDAYPHYLGSANARAALRTRSFNLTLPDSGETLTFEDLELVEIEGGYTLSSPLPRGDTNVELVIMGNTLTGTVRIGDEDLYVITPTGQGGTAVHHQRFDEPPPHSHGHHHPHDHGADAFIARELADIEPTLALKRRILKSPPPAPQTKTDSPPVIDVLFVYNQLAEERAGDIAARVALQVLKVNRIFADSDAGARLRVAGLYPIDYETAADIDSQGIAMVRAVFPDDGHLDDIPIERMRVGADMVTLLLGVKGTGYCGHGVSSALTYNEIHIPRVRERRIASAYNSVSVGSRSMRPLVPRHPGPRDRPPPRRPPQPRGVQPRRARPAHRAVQALRLRQLQPGAQLAHRHVLQQRRHLPVRQAILLQPRRPDRRRALRVCRAQRRRAHHRRARAPHGRLPRPAPAPEGPRPPPAPRAGGRERRAARLHPAPQPHRRRGRDRDIRLRRHGPAFRSPRHHPPPPGAPAGTTPTTSKGSPPTPPSTMRSTTARATGASWCAPSPPSRRAPTPARPPTGFASEVHERALHIPDSAPRAYHAPFLNPGSNRSSQGYLRIANPSSKPNTVTLHALDDRGEPGETEITVTIGPRAAVSLNARALEAGEPDRFEGQLGDGAGKWRVRVESADTRALFVLGLIRTPDGAFRNVSR